VKSCATEVVIETAARGALALRGGIAEGPVLSVDGGDLIGATVNRAAELCDESQPHEVLIDRGPRRRVASRGAAASTPARMIASLLRVRR
jgi:class 3 adenylate cyclase